MGRSSLLFGSYTSLVTAVGQPDDLSLFRSNSFLGSIVRRSVANVFLFCSEFWASRSKRKSLSASLRCEPTILALPPPTLRAGYCVRQSIPRVSSCTTHTFAFFGPFVWQTKKLFFVDEPGISFQVPYFLTTNGHLWADNITENWVLSDLKKEVNSALPRVAETFSLKVPISF